MWSWKDSDGTERKAIAEKKRYKKQLSDFNKRVKKKYKKKASPMNAAIKLK